ncbi:MAG: acyl-CoA/acyl-ACP dehydrogenase [Alphaproteobacteria bacterium]|nr:acyl-CoA/acyl-ACP dehydrogenase [Alphaproteobacteria bacterium]
MNDTQQILREMVERLFADHVNPPLLAQAEQGIWPGALWRLVEQQGLTRPRVPEEQGGLGCGWDDAFIIVRAAGYHGLPIPLPETIAASWLLSQAGLTSPDGPLTLGGAHPEDRLRLAPGNQGWRLSGTAHRVPWGRAAGSVVLVLGETGNLRIAHAACAGAKIEPGTNLAGEPRDRLSFTDHPVAVAPWPAAFADNPVRTIGAMLRSAQIAGALANALDRSITYANDRYQFGRPIAKQQAVQHDLARLAAEAAAVEVAAETAFLAAERGDPDLLVAAAKIHAGLAVPQATGIAHQVHGAIGFTLEHPLQWATRRLMSWRNEFGGDRQWSVILGRRILDLGADRFWPYLAAQ